MSQGFVFPMANFVHNLDPIYLIERFEIESNTDNFPVSIILETDVGFIQVGTFTTTTKSWSILPVNRLLHLDFVKFGGEILTQDVRITKINLYSRRVLLGIRLFFSGGMKKIIILGRFNAARTQLLFESNLLEAELDIQQVPTIRKLYVDVDSASQTITPVIEGVSGNTTLATINNATRTFEERGMSVSDRLIRLRLDADWTQPIALFQTELDIYLTEHFRK
ncbi:MAG: hypothetical protein V3W09_04105 [Nitrososphaerales archaeon]